jgi:hypothetical protein
VTGLREYLRDGTLPARAGEPELAPYSPARVATELLPRLAPQLELQGAPELVYARWKPGLSTLAAYGLPCGETQHWLALKLHADGAEAGRLAGDRSKGRFGTLAELELQWRAEPEFGRLAWIFPADRELPGAARLFDTGRLARWLAEQDLVDGERVRRKHTQVRLVRYRPESRAVLQLTVGLEGAGGAKRRLELAARCLPPAIAARVSEQRRRFEREATSGALAPPLLGWEPRTGLVLEPWLSLETRGSTEFGHAAAAGALLAALHRVAGWEAALRSSPPPLDPLVPWFERFPELAAARPALAAPPSRTRAWVHGDFHPDQVARQPATRREMLLDLDRLGAGDPADDLAEWIADRLAAENELEFAAAAEPLLDGYRAADGREPERDDLVLRCAAALVRRAAAALRRLEVDAVGRAGRLLERARGVAAEVKG